MLTAAGPGRSVSPGSRARAPGGCEVDKGAFLQSSFKNRVPLKGSIRATIRAIKGFSIGALIIRIGFRCPLYYTYNKEPPK